jgi:hypothetical protein
MDLNANKDLTTPWNKSVLSLSAAAACYSSHQGNSSLIEIRDLK